MSILSFKMRPGGAVLYEDAEENAYSGPMEFEYGDLEQASKELDDVEREVEMLPVPTQVAQVSPQAVSNYQHALYEEFKPFTNGLALAKVRAKCASLYQRADHIRLKSAEAYDFGDLNSKQVMMNHLDEICEFVNDFQWGMVMNLCKLTKLSTIIKASHEEFVFASAIGAGKLLRAFSGDITMNGYSEFHWSAPEPILPLRDIFRGACETIANDAFVRTSSLLTQDLTAILGYRSDNSGVLDNYQLRDIVLHLIDPDKMDKIIIEKDHSMTIDHLIESIHNSIRYASDITAESRNDYPNTNRFIDHLSRHLRWVMVEIHAMVFDLAIGMIDEMVFRNTVSRICDTLCNLYYLSVMVSYCIVFDIEDKLSARKAVSQYVQSVRRLVTKT